MKWDWLQWIEILSSTNVTPDERQNFAQALREDPAQLQAYLDALLLEAALEVSSLSPPPSLSQTKIGPIRRYPDLDRHLPHLYSCTAVTPLSPAADCVDPRLP